MVCVVAVAAAGLIVAPVYGRSIRITSFQYHIKSMIHTCIHINI